MRRFGLGDLALGDLRQTLIFIVVTTIAVAVSSLVWSPLIVLLWFGGGVWSAWYLTSLSNLLPFLIATPGLVLGFTRGADIIRKASLAQYTEFALLALGLLGCGIVIFGLQLLAVGKLPALLYAPLPFLLWAAVRFGPGGLSFSCLIFALMAIFSASRGMGPLSRSLPPITSFGYKYFCSRFICRCWCWRLWSRNAGPSSRRWVSEARYRGVVEDQTELICRFLPDGTYTFVNGAYAVTSSARRRSCSAAASGASSRRRGTGPRGRSSRPSRPTHPIATREHEVLAPDGEIRWQQWRDRGFFDDHGRVVEYQAVGRDITERKHAEDKSKRAASPSGRASQRTNRITPRCSYSSE